MADEGPKKSPSQELLAVGGTEGAYRHIDSLQAWLLGYLESVLERRMAVNDQLRAVLEADEGREKRMILRFFDTGNRREISQKLLDAYWTDRYPVDVRLGPPRPTAVVPQEKVPTKKTKAVEPEKP